ncbi:MAG: hypothetical protein LBH07_07470 [Treponema sp.]|jgi:hypothetical protein|nr:hypothetical protein [Treponema sp.]
MRLPAAIALFLIISLFTGCEKNGAVLITPLNKYTKEDIINKAEAYCTKYGMLPAEVRNDENIWQLLINDVIREFAYADLKKIHAEEISNADEPELTEQEIRSKYDELLASQKQYFGDKKEIVSAAIKYPRDTIVYYPVGLKYVKFFTVLFKAEIRGRAAILLSESKLGDYERLVEAAEADLMPLIRQVRHRIGSAGFDAVSAEYDYVMEDLLYVEDSDLLPAQQDALKTLIQIGDIAEYNTFQGRAFMLFTGVPDHEIVPYEEVREEIASSLLKNKIIFQNDRLMRKLYDEAIAAGSVKIRKKEIKEIGG